MGTHQNETGGLQGSLQIGFLTIKHKLISWIQHRLNDCGLTVIKNDHPGARYLTALPCTALTYALHRAFESLSAITFLQVGAHDGISHDPLYPLIKHWGWAGARVEPHPVYFATLQKQNLPNVELVQAAITSEDGTLDLYSINPELPKLPDWTAGLTTTSREKILQSCQLLNLPESAILSVKVDGLTWKSLFVRLSHFPVNLLCLDVEGMDIPLLHLWNWQQHRPRVVFFEHARAESEERHKLYETLTNHGYEICTEGVDTAAFIPKEKVI